MASAQSRTSALWGVEALRARLVHYPPGLRHGDHSHAAPHVSVVVAGSFRETTPRGEQVVCHGSIGFRADEARHSVCFGPAGALILTVALDDWIAEGVPRAGVRWVGASVPFARELLVLARRGGEEECDELADRLVALWTARPSAPPRGPAPAWLRDAAEQLLSAPGELSIAGLASRLGVHRVHFTRSFLSHYGMAPSVFRRRAMASRAVSAALAGPDSLAAAAADAGFADQSHMARVVREWCGVRPSELRALFAPEVTSIQAAAPATA
jgi:AraC family transcriptional regulator